MIKKIRNSIAFLIVIFSTTILYSQFDRFELITESNDDKTYYDNNTVKYIDNSIYTFWLMITRKTPLYEEIINKYIDYQLWKYELNCSKETIILKRVIIYYTDNTSMDGGEIVNLADDSIIPLTVGETIKIKICK